MGWHPRLFSLLQGRESMACCPPGAAPYLAADHIDEGKVGEAAGVHYYNVGTGSVGLLVLPDIWGWSGGRTRAVADEFAKKGLNVWVPKLLDAFEGGTEGDALPPDFDLPNRRAVLGPLFSGPWNVKAVLPRVQTIVTAMKTAGVKKFGVLGVCYGAWIGFHLSNVTSGKELICGASPHPSVHIEGMLGGDPRALAAGCQCPWALFPCGDPAAGGDGEIYDVGGSVYEGLEKNFPKKNSTKRFAAMKHGFLMRGAIKEGNFKAGDGDEVKAAVKQCVDDIMVYFKKSGLIGTAGFLSKLCICCS